MNASKPVPEPVEITDDNIKGPYDGQRIKYFFGRGHGGRFTVEATSLAKAIRAFRVGALFPHQYSSKPVQSKQLHRDGYEKSVCLSSEVGAYIPVHADVRNPETHRNDWTVIAKIAIEGMDFTELSPALIAAEGHLEKMGLADTTALAVAGSSTGLRNTSRVSLETKTLELERAMGLLAQQKSELTRQVQAMQEELKRRMEQIWMIELFLGSKEEVKRLAEGPAASANTPITVKQAVLCMDEEIAVWDWLHNPDRLGEFTWENLEDFDAWLVEDEEHLGALFPHDKGIVGLRVRRKEKDRSHYGDGVGAAFARMQEAEMDQMTYLLVRNGGNLYRLWVDVKLFPTLFPTGADYAALNEEGGWKRDKEDAEKKMKKYAAGLLVVQGLIERSDLFHPLPRHGISVFSPDDADCFHLVRDGEGRNLLADDTDDLAHLTWRGYREWLDSKLGEGVRVQWLGTGGYDREDTIARRTNIETVHTWPSKQEVYTIVPRPNSWAGNGWSFLYLPDEEIWGSTAWNYQDRQRTRRVRFETYSSELLPVDHVSWRVLEHLIKDRGQRGEYGSFFRKAFDWWKVKKEESLREKPFVDLVLREAKCGHGEADRARCERLVRWWKLKTKTHRDLGTDEAKALRMVRKAFMAGNDYDDDPEKTLLASMGKQA